MDFSQCNDLVHFCQGVERFGMILCEVYIFPAGNTISWNELFGLVR